MGRPSASASFTTEFGHEFEAERMAWLRRRFLWYMGVSIGIGMIAIISFVANAAHYTVTSLLAQYVVQGLGLVAHVAAFAYVWRHRVPRVPVLTIVYWLILGTGVLVLLAGPMIVGDAKDEVNRAMREGRAAQKSAHVEAVPTLPSANPDAGDPGGAGVNPRPGEGGSPAEKPRKAAEPAVGNILAGFVGVWTIFASHFFACVFLPWTPRESLRPVVPLIGLNAIITGGYAVAAVISGSWSWWVISAALGLIVASVLMPLPGMAVCAWRHGRFRKRFTFDALRGRYSELRQELTNARQIHESLFPEELATGPVRFEYTYEPMRQIGGDYLHAVVTPGDGGTGPACYSFAIVDVTGHGIPAALTVNRLHGELARIFAENPRVAPGEVLRLLNSYVHLTLATHSVYVTAICLRIDPSRDSLEYASGGHPPAFVRAVDGTIEQLDSTALVLGAASGPDFRSESRTLRFGPGDVVIAYTDGATEARDLQGRYFGIAGLQRLIASGRPDLDGGWPAAILRAVEHHRYGPTADDILVIEVRRPLLTTAGPSGAAAAKSGTGTVAGRGEPARAG